MKKKKAPPVVAERVERIASLSDELVAQRAEDRIGEAIEVLVESAADGEVDGRAEHQAPEVDGAVRVRDVPPTVVVADIILATVAETDGVDLVAVME